MIDRQLSKPTTPAQPMQADYSYNQWRRDHMQQFDRDYAEHVAQEQAGGAN